MTTHESQAEVTGSYDESQAAAAETPTVSEHTAPSVSVDPSTASAEPSQPSAAPPQAVGEQQNPTTPSVESAEPSTARSEAEPSGAARAGSAKHSSVEGESSTEQLLFGDDDLAELRARWAGVQAAFVDDPKECVQKADVLVSDLVEQLTNGFAHARSRLEEQWARGEEASTEDLRVALMHYREFFERLLAV